MALVITKVKCNSFTVENTFITDTDYSISQIIDNELVIISEDTITAGDTITVDLVDDGVFVLTRSTTNYLLLSDCNITTCYKYYLDKLLSCNTETNCDCDKELDLYNFNAFELLYNSYLSFMNQEIYLGTQLKNDELTALMSEIYVMDDILNRALNYCELCDKPCTNC